MGGSKVEQTSANVPAILNIDLHGRVAVVTGAGRGIGAATARTLAAAGAAVVCASRSEEELSAVVEDIRGAGGEALCVPTDVMDPAAVERLVKRAVAQYGKLDIALNNVGVSIGGALHEIKLDDFDRVVASNLRATFVCLKYEIAAMLNSGGGAIVNTASVHGVVAWSSFSPYIASKHGLIGLTKAAAIEYASRNIRVNCVAPGATRTAALHDALRTQEQLDWVVSKVPMGRLADPQEIANAAVYLLSDAASFITGATLMVDGGLILG